MGSMGGMGGSSYTRARAARTYRIALPVLPILPIALILLILLAYLRAFRLPVRLPVLPIPLTHRLDAQRIYPERVGAQAQSVAPSWVRALLTAWHKNGAPPRSIFFYSAY